MIPNLYVRGAAAGREMVRGFGARLILSMGYGLRQVPPSERQTVLENGLGELWFLSMLVVQWWADRLPSAESQVVNRTLAPFSLGALAGNLSRARERLEPFVRAAYEANTDANLAGAGIFFKALLDEVGVDTLTAVLRFLPLGEVQNRLMAELSPPAGLQAEFVEVLRTAPASPPFSPTTRGERFDRADLGERIRPTPPVRPPDANLDAQQRTRGYVATLGWSQADLDRIMGGPAGRRNS